jgi:hypothetical protein
MNRKEVVDLITGLEERYPVEDWRLQGVDLWPVLRNLVFSTWFFQNEESKGAEKEKKATSRSAFRKLLLSVLYWLKFIIAPPKRADILFSGSATFRVNFSGASMNRYFDPIMDHLEESKISVISAEQRSDNLKGCYKRDRIISFGRFFPMANIIIKLKYKKTVSTEIERLTDLKACLEEIQQLIPGIHAVFLKRQLAYMASTILAWAFVFDKVLARVKPRYVFGLCYYSLPMYGMNLSAHRRGISSVDMQHGTQGELQINYSKFTKVPIDGHTVMPKIFWCWDETSASNIKKWTNLQHFHRVVVGGNPWVDYLRKINLPLDAQGKKLILYTLQPIEPLLEPYVLETIKNTSDVYTWWLRIHPRQIADKPRLEKLLKANGVLPFVNLEEASNLPLPMILKHTAVHVSRFSGAVIEAALLGVVSIVTDETGVTVFEPEIRDGSVLPFLDKSAVDFAKLLEKAKAHRTDATESVNFAEVFKQHFTS